MDYEERQRLDSALAAIPVADLPRDQWLAVGMALKDAGIECSAWDSWSHADERYRKGECERLWQGFRGSAKPVGLGTIFKLAQDYGWKVHEEAHALDWDTVITEDGPEFHLPDEWDPVAELTEYINALFKPDEHVGYVVDLIDWGDRKSPSRGDYDRTAGQLLDELSRCRGDLSRVIGTTDPQVGAWIRFNPVDGEGVKNDNVTRFTYALVESDTMSLSDQEATYRRLQLPAKFLIYSGSKSIHAIVRVDARDMNEYRERVDYLYEYLSRNGVDVDKQNRNPSRLSRMPGIMRDGKRQRIMARDIGKASWAEWQDWAEGEQDDLPPLMSYDQVMDDLPPLAPELIHGILRQGHKMLLTAPSKAGKTWALIELAMAIAEGRSWMGFDCERGKVLYINFEIQAASFWHRISDLYERVAWECRSPENLLIWNMRGHASSLDKLLPKLRRRIRDLNLMAIIVDPIYKITQGDENSAQDMGAFMNEIDRVAEQTGAAVIICHHHSKGAAGAKDSQDRMSGSGVFARDPDAILDMSQLMMDRTATAQLCDGEITTAWRITSTLREFPAAKPVNVLFRQGWHEVDTSGLLDELPVIGESTLLAANIARGTRTGEDWSRDIAEAVTRLDYPTPAVLADDLGVAEDTLRRKLKGSGFMVSRASGRVIEAR